MPKKESFTKAELSSALSMKLMPHNSNHFRKDAPMIKVITKVLIDSYISETAFGSLRLVELKGETYRRQKINLTYKWNNVEDFSKLY